MGTRTEHAPGTFSWVDLSTTDVAAAKEFYGGLFGWQFEDTEAPDGSGIYAMCTVDGDSVAAISPPFGEGPPRWNSYVTVAGADDAAAKANELGGNVVMGPFDVGEAGRMAVLLDPTGAALSVWEPRDSIGATRVNDPSCLSWNELHTPDHDRALEFYTALFGWGTEEVDTQGGPRYTTLMLGERTNGGVIDAQPGEPPHWLPYFVVEDRDAAASQATAHGATEVVRMDLPTGNIAILRDPQGAVFGIFAGPTDE